MPAGRLLSQALALNKIVSRNMFTGKISDPHKPKKLRVALAIGSTIFVWALLISQHRTDVKEYKRLNGLD